MNRYLVLFVLLFLNQATWAFQFPLDEKVADAILSPVSPLSNSPASAPFSSSMTAFSPEIVDNMAVPGRKLGIHRRGFHALIIASASVGVLIMSLLCLWFYHKKISDKPPAKKNAKGPGSVGGIALSQIKGGILSFMKTNSRRGSVAEFDYKTLETATGNFQESNVVGEGGFGCVYKARLDEDYYVAVKKVDGGCQDAEREFQNELDLLSKIKHANIVSLLGYCICEQTRFLVYELMKNGSLETQLHGPSHGSALTWHLRMKIALDVARGLEYLHEHCHPPVIHRDLKSSNILLDSNFNAKLSDFGFAVADGSQDRSSIKLSGTMGYVAPEYLSDGKLSDKSDVYAFGVVLLELLLGRKPVEKLSPAQCQSLVTWAMPQLTDRSKLLNIVDPAIKNSMDLKHLYQVAAVAVLCVQPEPSYRPLITDVLHSLIPLVPVELGGTHRASHRPSVSNV